MGKRKKPGRHRQHRMLQWLWARWTENQTPDVVRRALRATQVEAAQYGMSPMRQLITELLRNILRRNLENPPR